MFLKKLNLLFKDEINESIFKAYVDTWYSCTVYHSFNEQNVSSSEDKDRTFS